MDKTPVSIVEEIYKTEYCPRSFEEDLYLHMFNPHAIVFKDATSLALLRPVTRHASYEKLTNPEVVFKNPNCWWIYLLVGDMHHLFQKLPYPLEYIGWERNNIPRSYKLTQLTRWMNFKDPISTQLLLGLPDV